MGILSRPNLHRYLAYLLAWTLFGLFNFSRDLTSQFYRHEQPHWRETLMVWIVGAFILAALTPLVLWVGRR